MRNNIMTNPVSRYIFTVNILAGGGSAWAARQLNFLGGQCKRAFVKTGLFRWGGGHFAIPAMRHKNN